MTLLRTPLSMSISGVLTVALFLLMSHLIADRDIALAPPEPFAGIHFGPVEIDVEPDIKRPPPPERPKPPVRPPEAPKISLDQRTVDPVIDMNLDIPDLDFSGDGGFFPGGGGLGQASAEGGVVATVVIRPQYPREAAMRNLEGWVRVAFTINPIGEVQETRVIDADPPRVFNKAALQAIQRWKFNPRVVNGVAVSQQATQVIQFSLGDE